MSENSDKNILEQLGDQKYEAGFVTNIETETFEKGLSEDIIRRLSALRNEPEEMLQFRLKAYAKWKEMKMPNWAHLTFQEPDYQDLIYYAAPKKKAKLNSLDEVDPELLKTYEKLGIPLSEQKELAGVAVDAVFDSESVHTTMKKQLAEKGIIFCPISEAIRE